MRTTPRSTAAAAAAAALLLAGCGADADVAAPATDDTTTPATDDTSASATNDTSASATDDTTVTIEHAQGTTTLDATPETIVVFDVGSLETLQELGVEVAGVPELGNVPSQVDADAYAEATVVGTLFEPDYEQVAALEPDLVVVGGRSAAVHDELAEIAPTVDMTLGDEYLPSLRERTLALAGAFGDATMEAAAARLDAADERIAEVRGLAEDAGTGLVLLTTGGEVSAYGPGSRFGLVHDLLGVAPADPDIPEADHGNAVSFEYVLDVDPDMLFVVDRDAAIGEADASPAQAVLDNELVARTAAWQDGAVTYLDGGAWYIAPNGLGSLDAIIDDVHDAVA